MSQENEESLYPSKTDEELRNLAIDFRAGRIFTDRDVQDPMMLGMVFMVFLFVDGPLRKALQANPPGLIYEYYSKAGYRSINGMPTFLSVNMLSREQTKKVSGYVKKLFLAEKTVGL